MQQLSSELRSNVKVKTAIRRIHDEDFWRSDARGYVPGLAAYVPVRIRVQARVRSRWNAGSTSCGMYRRARICGVG